MILPSYFLNKSRADAQGQISIWCPALCLVGCDLSQTRGGEQLHIWLRPNIRTLHKSEVKPETWRQNFLLFACCDCETSTPALSIVLKDLESGWSDSQIREPLLLYEGFSCYMTHWLFISTHYKECFTICLMFDVRKVDFFEMKFYIKVSNTHLFW